MTAPDLILCSTPRLARSLQSAYSRRQQGAGLLQWAPLPVMTLSGWLERYAEEALLTWAADDVDAPRAMSPMQERLIWEQAIEASLKNLDSAPLFDKAGLAAAAQEANRLLIEWNLSLPSEEQTEETRQFLLWRQRFQATCRQSGWLEPVRYFSWQVQMVASAKAALPQSIALAGFDRISPQLQQLIDTLRGRGSLVTHFAPAFDAPQPARHIVLPDQDAECRAAVAWAHDYLAQHPDARLAIVVPELAALRSKLSALLDEAFEPGLIMPRLAQKPRIYDFSLGRALTTQPIVSDALALLRFGMQRHQVPQADLSALLHSPYWSASFSEADARARLDARLREWLPLHASPQRLVNFVQKAVESQPALPVAKTLDALQQLVQRCHSQPSRQMPSAWARAFRDILVATHWPGERTPSSHEYQAMQSFEKVCNSLSQLDGVLGSVQAGEALRRLVQLCKEQIFQPEAEADPGIQVMGMLEAAAEPLDAVWVMGMNDHVWPPAPHPNPMLPASLQRSAKVPNADSAAQAAFAEAIHQRLLRSGREIIFSSAEKDDERVLRPSPLMHGLAGEPAGYPLQPTLAEVLANEMRTSGLQFIDDHQAPAVSEGQHLAGGTGLLKAQAICPAWAFYQYRLYARELRVPVNGLDAMERGTLVHAALEFFWQERGSRDIHDLPAEALGTAVSEAALQALVRFGETRESAFSPSFLALEQARLTKLVLAWLTEVELKRPQPFKVIAREQKQVVEIEGVSITLVVDRIDALDDGRLIVMDYKTGLRNDYRNWAAERITEPQLPIYAAFVLAADTAAAVCFAQVRMDKSGFVGIAAEAELVQGAIALEDKKGREIFAPGDFPDWPGLLEQWKLRISRIAQELKSGEASVRFASEQDLAYCEVLPLLRLPERQLQFERQQTSESAAHD
jgi:probable DNA repair protein